MLCCFAIGCPCCVMSCVWIGQLGVCYFLIVSFIIASIVYLVLGPRVLFLG